MSQYGAIPQAASKPADLVSDAPSRHAGSRREFSRFHVAQSSSLASVVQALEQQSGEELGATTSAKVSSATYDSLMDWIRSQRMTKLPPEGGPYDKVLTWAQMFIERLHSFDIAIENIAPDSYMAAQLAYGYCSILLELGEENVSALVASFGFFYSTSMILVNILERAELFHISQDIREQLVLALGDLVTLVASVATHFHKALRGLSSAPVSINIHATFRIQIENFRNRCDKITESMWKHQFAKDDLDLSRVSEIKAIHYWTQPVDRILMQVDSPSFFAKDREELTCLWLAPYLSRFLKSTLKSLYITGKSGSGKTVLSSVINDHLQHPIGGVSYDSIFVPINRQISVEATPRTAVKSILRQIFAKRIGNTRLFQILSTALDNARKTVDQQEYDNNLWNALESVFSSVQRGSKDIVIIVDGVDEVYGGSAHFLSRLLTATSKAPSAKLIALGSEKPKPVPGRANLTVTQDLILDDISAVIRRHLSSTAAFSALDEIEQEILVDRFSQAAEGSFLWAQLAAKSISAEQTPDSFNKSVDSILRSKMTITDFVFRITQEKNVPKDALMILLWLATSRRPLTLQEVACLVSVDISKKTYAAREINVISLIKPLEALIIIQNGLAYLRHDQIRMSVFELRTANKFLPQITDAHADIVKRLFVYIRSIDVLEREPSMSALDFAETSALLSRNALLEFALLYWVDHIRGMAIYNDQGEKSAAKELKPYFPQSTTIGQLQRAVWRNLPTPELYVTLEFNSTITREIFTTEHFMTLQSTIFLALIYRNIGNVEKAHQLFYEGTVVSRKILNPRHFIAAQMSSLFLETTETLTTDTRTSVMNMREEVMLSLLDTYKAQYGAGSEPVIGTVTQLAKLYKQLKEEDKASHMYDQLQALTVQVYGAASSEAKDLTTETSVVLRSRNNAVTTRDGLMLDLEEEVDELIPADADNFAELMEKARKDKVVAERVYIDLLRRTTAETKKNSSPESEERKLDVVIAYAEFLQAHGRKGEASALLSSVWKDHENNFSQKSDATVSKFQRIGHLMRNIGLGVGALALFKKIADHFKSSNRHQTHPEQYQQVQHTIQTTTDEIIEASGKEGSTNSEETLEEIIFSRHASSHKKRDKSYFTAVSTLYNNYLKLHRWQDSTRLVNRVLENLWPELSTTSVQDVSLPSENLKESLELTSQLCRCYHARRQFTQEEDVRNRVYRAVRVSRSVTDELYQESVTELLKVYEENQDQDKMIALRQEMLSDHIKAFGSSHKSVINLLYTLADLTRPRPIFVDYHKQIIAALNKDSDCCSKEALDSVIIVAEELYLQGRYSEAHEYQRLLFNTFLKKPGLNEKFKNEQFVKTVFTRYSHCQTVCCTEYKVIHQTAVEYHKACKTTFTSTSTITTQSALHLAKVCQDSKRNEKEAISVYESLLSSLPKEYPGRTDIVETLESLYEDQDSSLVSSTDVSVESLDAEQSMEVFKKRVYTTRQKMGWDHPRVLARIPTMVKYHQSRNDSDSIVTDLKQTASNVLSNKSVAATGLIATASLMAAGFLASKRHDKAEELSEELHRQIILKDNRNAHKFNFNLSSKEKDNLIFLAQFENSMRQNQQETLTESLSCLMSECIYFEEFRTLLERKASLLEVFTLAAQLHKYLLEQNRPKVADQVIDQLVTYFLSIDGKKIPTAEKPLVRVLVSIMVEHFKVYISDNFIHSVAITGNNYVRERLAARDFDAALNISILLFQYLSAYEAYKQPNMIKYALNLGMAISARDIEPRPEEAVQKRLLATADTIVRYSLEVIRELKISITQLNLHYLNRLSGLLGELKDFQSLSWFLGLLWSCREAQRDWPAYVTFTLGHRYIIVRYLVGDSLSALRLAEDITYNCRRVYGARHPGTLQASILLTQLYTSIAQRYQEKKGQDMADRYYKKSVSVHENILRVFVDPLFAEINFGSADTFGLTDSTFSRDLSFPVNDPLNEIDHVRQHYRLLKLAIQRHGDWIKDFGEYERLCNDIYSKFKDLDDAERVDKWNLKSYGRGRAEGDEDLLDVKFSDWELFTEESLAVVPTEQSSAPAPVSEAPSSSSNGAPPINQIAQSPPAATPKRLQSPTPAATPVSAPAPAPAPANNNNNSKNATEAPPAEANASNAIAKPAEKEVAPTLISPTRTSMTADSASVTSEIVPPPTASSTTSKDDPKRKHHLTKVMSKAYHKAMGDSKEDVSSVAGKDQKEAPLTPTRSGSTTSEAKAHEGSK